MYLVIAHSFCIVKLLIYCINNLHMYRTLYQAGMFKTAFKKKVCFAARQREGNRAGREARQGGAPASVKALPVWASPSEIMGADFLAPAHRTRRGARAPSDPSRLHVLSTHNIQFQGCVFFCKSFSRKRFSSVFIFSFCRVRHVPCSRMDGSGRSLLLECGSIHWHAFIVCVDFAHHYGGSMCALACVGSHPTWCSRVNTITTHPINFRDNWPFSLFKMNK